MSGLSVTDPETMALSSVVEYKPDVSRSRLVGAGGGNKKILPELGIAIHEGSQRKS